MHTASSRIPLSMRLTWDSAEHGSKRQYVRHTWPGWRPTSEGQFSDLLCPDSWESMEMVEQDISRAGRVGALRRWGQSRTPLDEYEKKLIHCRRSLPAEARSDRLFIQRCIFDVRRQKRARRAKDNLMRANLAGRDLPDKPCRGSFILRGKATASASVETFRTHWAHNMTTPACPDTYRVFMPVFPDQRIPTLSNQETSALIPYSLCASSWL